MISITSEQACLLELIKAALFDKTPLIPDEANWHSIFEDAKAQCIVPLLATVVPVDHRAEWLSISYQSKARFMQMMHEQNNIVNLFRDNNIPFAILKGTAAAIYYPNPSLRTYGDIDVYLSENNMNRARICLEENGYTYIHHEVRHYEYEKNGFEFELHSRFSSEYYNDIEHILLNGLNNAIEEKIGSSSFPVLPKFENGLVLLGHIMMHLKTSGIGFRQIIDWMMFVHKELYNDDIWFDKFKSLAVEAGLEKLAKTVTFMCKKWLGLPDNISWCDDVNEDVADQLLIRLLIDANLGRERAPFENVKYYINNEGFIKYFLRTGVENWPLAQKYSILKPLAFIFGLFRLFYKSTSRLIKGEKVFRKDKHIMSLVKLIDKLV